MIEVDITSDLGSFQLRVQLKVESGTTVVIGPNGAGKTTLLRSLLGARRPDSGSIRVGSRVLFSSADNINVLVEERRLGYLPQRYALFPHMTVADNIGFGISQPEEREATVKRLTETLGISQLASRRPARLSGGEAQRVALARALAINPAALLLDEPMGALDAGTRSAVRKFLAETLAELEIPSIVVSHDVADAVALADRIAVLENGEITQVGSLDELRASPESDFVSQFVGG